MSGTADREIAALRQAEAKACARQAEVDRLAQNLANHYACNFMVANGIPDGTWVNVAERRCVVRVGRPPRDHRGYVAVSLATLRQLAKEVQ